MMTVIEMVFPPQMPLVWRPSGYGESGINVSLLHQVSRHLLSQNGLHPGIDGNSLDKFLPQNSVNTPRHNSGAPHEPEWLPIVAKRLNPSADVLHLNWHQDVDAYDHSHPEYGDDANPLEFFLWAARRASGMSIMTDMIHPFDDDDFKTRFNEPVKFRTLAHRKQYLTCLQTVIIHMHDETALLYGDGLFG
jgi:hypothetical protein